MIFIFDIDGVLADDSTTRHLDCTDPQQRAEFTRRVPTLRPLKQNIALVQKLAAAGSVRLFTARSAAIRVLTQNWLYDQQVPHDDLYMRPFGNMDRPEVLKHRMLQELMLNTGVRPAEVLACDDDPAVQEMYLNWGASVLKLGENRG
ncbi:phosphatase domain-containing protein [Candidatus Avelusimicrobium facis]|uniref:phosphatase domain-containing protein n=1 Tax=Candidatus Avelusimicrobium facis TaxID=3416203 RepID=UPI0015B5E2A8